MSTITLPYHINNGNALDADKVMANENAIVTEYNASVAAKAGDPVSTAEVQELSNKTLVSPIIKPVAGAAPTVAGTLGFNDTTKQLVYGNGTAAIPVGQQYRAFSWYLDGTSIVADNLGAKYIVPQTMTTVTARYKLTSGTCSFRLKKNGTEFVAPNNADSTGRASAVAVSLAAGDVLTLDIWAAASPVNLAVTLECVQ